MQGIFSPGRRRRSWLGRRSLLRKCQTSRRKQAAIGRVTLCTEPSPLCYVPLSVGGGPIFGVLTFAVMREERDWPETVVKGLQLIAQVFANALARKRADEEITKHLKEIEKLKQRLEKENIYLQEEVKLLVEHTEIVGQSLCDEKGARLRPSRLPGRTPRSSFRVRPAREKNCWPGPSTK